MHVTLEEITKRLSNVIEPSKAGRQVRLGDSLVLILVAKREFL